MLAKRLIKSNDAGGGGACTNTVDLYNPFPDGGGVALYQLNGDATDVSGNYDGTAANVTYGAGQFGQAGVFNGSSSYIDTALNSSAVSLSSDFTISAWVNIDNFTSSYSQILVDGSNASWAALGFSFQVTDTGALRLNLANNGSSAGVTLTSSAVLSLSTWYNVIAVIDVGNEIRLYLNGVSVANSSISSGARNTIGNWQIGRDTSGGRWFDGSIDQVRIFSRALRPYEVEALYTEEYCTPTIVPSEHFNTVLYTGNDGVNPRTDVGFAPDFVWIKARTDARTHSLIDTVRGVGSILISDGNIAEFDGTPYIESFDSNGFTVKSNSAFINNSAQDYVAWNFKAGGAAVTNTDGTITSQVSANTEAGFSVVKWNSSSNVYASVGHGLGQEPKVIIMKRYSTTGDWLSFFTYLGGGKFLRLNTTGAVDTWGDGTLTPVTSSTITNLDGGSEDYIAYCFAEVEGFSNFGSYVGTGASGNTVVTGFEPAFVMIKRTDGTSSWYILDNKRDTTNPRDLSLSPDLSSAEGNIANFINFYDNGFSLAGTAANGTGQKWIYMAFAADPTTIEPSLEDSFNTVIWSGNGSTQSVTGVGFQPDFVWAKSRTGTTAHNVFDSIRGTTQYISTNLTDAEATVPNSLQSFNTDGFTVGSNPGLNWSSNNYVAWAWKGAELPAINSNGSIPSVVSANPAAGFSIVSYTGNGANGDTVGHGLSAVPNVVIWKNRSDARNWVVWHSGLTSIDYSLILNSTSAEVLDSRTNRPFGQPTDSVLVLGEDNETNFSPNKFIAYCFAEVAGFSKFGSFTGNGVSGRVIDCAFEPAFVLVKRTNGGANWVLFDNKRNGDPKPFLLPNDSSIEATVSTYTIQMVSNGFRIDVGNTGLNATDADFIFMAFANQF
jgi:hypothetical protein